MLSMQSGITTTYNTNSSIIIEVIIPKTNSYRVLQKWGGGVFIRKKILDLEKLRNHDVQKGEQE